MFAETSGMVMPVPSSGASETANRLPTLELEGTRNTSE
jgi:hypothetical protein